MKAITDHEFTMYQPEYINCCQFVYKPNSPGHVDPSGGWMMGGPIEYGETPEQHTRIEAS